MKNLSILLLIFSFLLGISCASKKHGVIDGERIAYGKNGVILAKGIYKNNKPWTGTFWDKKGIRETIFTYKNGNQDGVCEVSFNFPKTNMKIQGEYQKNTPWTGSFHNMYIHDYENMFIIYSFEKGKLIGTKGISKENGETKFNKPGKWILLFNGIELPDSETEIKPETEL